MIKDFFPHDWYMFLIRVLFLFYFHVPSAMTEKLANMIVEDTVARHAHDSHEGIKLSHVLIEKGELEEAYHQSTAALRSANRYTTYYSFLYQANIYIYTHIYNKTFRSQGVF